MYLCATCYTHGYCRRLVARPVTDDELRNSDFVRDLRAHALRLGIAAESWPSFLIEAYRDYPGTVRDGTGREVFLDTGVFEGPHLRYWFRDFACSPCPSDVTPRIRREARERARAMATILRAIDPVAGAMWGRSGANDYAMPLLPAPRREAASGCPYPRLLTGFASGGMCRRRS